MAASDIAIGAAGRPARLVGTLLIQLVLCALALETAARLLDPMGISFYPETAAWLDTLVLEEPIGYRNRPGLRGTFWGVPVAINAQGLRDREVAAERPAGEFRIAMLGDSIVFGVGVAADATISYRLEQQLNQREDQRTRYRVLNMGVTSYNTLQEQIQLKQLGLALDPQLVLLVLTANDVEPKMWVLERRAGPLARLAQRSYAASLLALLYWDLRVRLTGHDTRYAYRLQADDGPGWQMVEAALGRIAALCRERLIPFVLLARGDFPRLEPLARELDFPLVRLMPFTDDARWRDRQPFPDYVVSRVNGHPNRAGAEIEATVIRESLERLRLLPGAQEPGW